MARTLLAGHVAAHQQDGQPWQLAVISGSSVVSTAVGAPGGQPEAAFLGCTPNSQHGGSVNRSVKGHRDAHTHEDAPDGTLHTHDTENVTHATHATMASGDTVTKN
ncbi:hypothetical protein TREES_T100011486 [Tupaia chinensis]|uniref:Uncharacterized protein n=1 Tax=Tupaia chinensis TaxID=246437 RepID=L9LBD8_TUPCH|nr:hypothetical protein TREES_T100011486 [Tupaia chinensis]